MHLNSLCLLLSKGNRVNIPEPGRGYRCFGICCGNANEPGDVGRSPGKSSLFFVRDELRGIASRGDTDVVPVKHRGFAVSGALLLTLENPGEIMIFTPDRTHIRSRSPRLTASSL